MYKALSFALLLLLVSESGALLLRKGWYRTQTKGRKLVLNNVNVFDDSTVPNSNYLRIGGRIPTLPKGSIRNLNRTTILKFSFCGMTHVLPGAFENLPNLAVLSLLDNEIDHVRAGVFNHLNITSLYLQRNQISTVDTKAFDDMPKLYKVKLNANKITVWDPNWFENTPSLTELFFRRNEIQEVPSNAFKNLKGSHRYKGDYLVDTKIYLSKNSISRIAPDALKGLEELSQLWLDRNQLDTLDGKVFSEITQLGTLFLSKNKLEQLPGDMFRKLSTDVEILDLAGNNNMTCLPYDIVYVVKLTNIQHIHKLNCKCVEKLKARLKEANRNNEISTDCDADVN